MILFATLAITDYCPTIVNAKRFAGRGALERTEGCNRLVSRKYKCEEISVLVLTVAGDLAGIVDGAGGIQLTTE